MCQPNSQPGLEEFAEPGDSPAINDVYRREAGQLFDELNGCSGLRCGAGDQIRLEREALSYTNDCIRVGGTEYRADDVLAELVDRRVAIVWLER